MVFWSAGVASGDNEETRGFTKSVVEHGGGSEPSTSYMDLLWSLTS